MIVFSLRKVIIFFKFLIAMVIVFVIYTKFFIFYEIPK